MKKHFTLLILYLLCIFTVNARTKTTEEILSEGKIRILAIGNSFSSDAVEQNLYELFNAAGIDAVIGNMYIGGCTLQTHWTNLDNNIPAYAYIKILDGVRKEYPDKAIQDVISDEDWDIITFQQASGSSGLYSTYEPFLTNLIDWFSKESEAQLWFHQTWAYSQDSNHKEYGNYNKNQLVMYNAIINAVKLAIQNHPEIVGVIPSGTAIQNVRTTSIGDNMTRDGYHLEYTYGRYTAACAWFELLSGMDVRENSYFPPSIDLEKKKIIQQAVHYAAINPFEITNQNFPQQITLNIESMELPVGETILLVAQIVPEDTPYSEIKWSTTDEKIAYVYQNGFVKAISPGSALITAICQDISATCKITVLEESGVKSLFVNPDSKITVYTSNGVLINKDCRIEELNTLSKGLYIVVSENGRYKISL